MELNGKQKELLWLMYVNEMPQLQNLPRNVLHGLRATFISGINAALAVTNLSEHAKQHFEAIR